MNDKSLMSLNKVELIQKIKNRESEISRLVDKNNYLEMNIESSDKKKSAIYFLSFLIFMHFVIYLASFIFGVTHD